MLMLLNPVLLDMQELITDSKWAIWILSMAYLKLEGREIESESHWTCITLMAVPSDRLSICLELPAKQR